MRPLTITSAKLWRKSVASGGPRPHITANAGRTVLTVILDPAAGSSGDRNPMLGIRAPLVLQCACSDVGSPVRHRLHAGSKTARYEWFSAHSKDRSVVGMRPLILTSLDDGVDLAFSSLTAERLAVVAGAGLSMAAPSSLPNAWHLAEAAQTKYALAWGPTKPPLPNSVEDQAEFFFARNELQTIYLSSLIDRNAFAGRTNAGHTALADLMLSGVVQTVVTTNVDSLIESAGSDLFGQIETGIDGAGVAALPPNVTPMLKIHGCRSADWLNTLWAAGQIGVEPVHSRIASSIPWVTQRLMNRDLVVVGYWTDWDYLNLVLDQALNAVNPTRVIIVDPADSGSFATKAPALFSLGQRATNGFYHVKNSGNIFLAALRKRFSQYILRAILYSGIQEYTARTGVAPNPMWLEPPLINDDQMWLLRRDLLGCAPNAPATSSKPPNEPLLGLTLLQLQAAGASPDGANWQLGGKTIRVLRTPNQILPRVEAEYEGDVAPIVAPDYIIAVGAQARALPASIARGAAAASIARASGGIWLSYEDAVAEFAL